MQRVKVSGCTIRKADRQSNQRESQTKAMRVALVARRGSQVFYPVWKAMELPAEFGYTTLLWLHDFIGFEIILAH
jgi:hypothetical protein